MAFVLVTGVEELDASLRRLSTTGAKAASRKALAAGMKVFVQALRQNAPRGVTGNLNRSIGWRFIKSRDADPRTLAKAGPDVGKKKFQMTDGKKTLRNPGAHGHLIALGTKLRTREEIGGKYKSNIRPDTRDHTTGVGPINNFVRRAQTAAGATSKSMIGNRLKTALVEEYQKDAAGRKQRARPA